MNTFVIKAEDGGAVSLSTLTGLPFWSLALIFGVITVFFAFKFSKKNKNKKYDGPHTKTFFKKIFLGTWKPWHAGLAIGILSMVGYLSSAESGRNYPLGVTHGVLFTKMIFTEKGLNHLWQKNDKPLKTAEIVLKTSSPAQEQRSSKPKQKKIIWWLVGLVCSLMLGSWISGMLSGTARLLPKPPEQIVIAFFGGILVGTGAAFAGGCVVGNIISGWALMSVGMFLFGTVVILTNWATTYVYLMGGSLPGIKRG
jgi:quinol-cytochrome oxidoreductase complex cytochrome b subunit